MKNFTLLLFFVLLILPAQTAVMEGGVSKTGVGEFNRIVDSDTNLPIAGARVSLPKQNYSTYTDNNGAFELNAKIKDNSILVTVSG